MQKLDGSSPQLANQSVHTPLQLLVEASVSPRRMIASARNLLRLHDCSRWAHGCRLGQKQQAAVGSQPNLTLFPFRRRHLKTQPLHLHPHSDRHRTSLDIVNNLAIMSVETNATITAFGGRLLKLSHKSHCTKTTMNFTLFLPASATASSPAPLLIYLSGLTCTPDNVTEKGFLHAHAAPLGLALLYPDTSPRGLDLPGEDEAYDFGSGASFYLDAQEPPWNKHYRMESYITEELRDVVFKNFTELDRTRLSISGHSMGGHGALTLYLRNPGMYKSVSAWAPSKYLLGKGRQVTPQNYPFLGHYIMADTTSLQPGRMCVGSESLQRIPRRRQGSMDEKRCHSAY